MHDTEFHPTSDYFTAFRKDYGFPYFYREKPLYLFREVGWWGVGVGYITAVLAITVIIAFLGTRGYSRWRITLQMVISLSIGFSIILAVTGVGWQVGRYEGLEGGDIVRYKLRIGLEQANITMARMIGDTEDYSEFHNVKIGWEEVYQAKKEYRDALLSGWPDEILRIARYVTADWGHMRHMRSFRWSGYAAKVLLWAGFSSWILANVLMGSNVTYSAALLLLTGGLQLLACIVYDAQKPKNFLIMMDDDQSTKLRLSYDWMFWLTLFMGLFVVLMAAIILVLDYLRPADMNKFFGTTAEYTSPFDDEVQILENENKSLKKIMRSVSQKHLRKDSKKSQHRNTQNNLDVEGNKKSFNILNGNGSADNHAYVRHQVNGTSDMEVPDIQVEMVDITEHKPNNTETVELPIEDDIDIDSELGTPRNISPDFSPDIQVEREGMKPRASIVSTTLSDKQLLSHNHN